MGVGVGCGVFSSMMGGWSPTTGGSVVRKVENMPDGGVGEEAGSLAGPPQAIIVSSARAPAAIIKSAPSLPLPVVPSNIPPFTPSHLSVEALFWIPVLPMWQG